MGSMKNFPKIRLIVLSMAAATLTLLWSVSPPRTYAATITVDTAVDELDGSPGNGSCSLREAINNANTDSAGQADCAAGSGADIIIFDSSLDSAPITLSRTGANENGNSTGDLDILSPIIVNGNNANRTIIDGGDIDRVFDLPTGSTLTLNGVTVQNGDAPVGSQAHGGGIRNLLGSLIVNAAHIVENTQSDPDGTTGGGGIFNSGTLTVTNSTINDNYSIGGGGGGGIASVQSTAVASITNSTISGNRSNANGGGIITAGGDPTLTLVNVTMTANVANDDNVGPGGGGGLRHTSGATTVSNTIIAGNTAFGAPTRNDCHNGSGITTNGYNLRPVGTGCDGALNDATDMTVATLGLGPLQDNGGPTPTHNLLAGSDAIDQIPTANCAATPADQRGVARADGIATGATCDVGAVEYIAPLAASAANGGDGPGGVGVTNGSSSLELWLRGDQGVFADAGCISAASGGGSAGCWQDQSGNGNHATESGTASPTYLTGVQNGQSSIRFDGVNDGFNLNSTLLPTGNSARTFIFATQANAGADIQSTFSYGTNAAGQRINVTTIPTETAVAVNLHTYGIISGTTSWQTAVFDIPGGSNSDGWDFYRDGLQLGPEGTIVGSPQTVNTGAADADLGRASFNAYFYDGNIAETIVYSVELPPVQRILVDNYLSAKYDISLGANDVYTGDIGANGNFDLDVAGIGQVGGNQHTQAHSVGMVLRDRSFLQNDGDWLLFGHRSVTNTNTINDLPMTGDWNGAPDPRRWERHWFIDVTDVMTTGGMVDIIFDFSEGSMDAIMPGGPVNNYRLLGRTGETGDFSDIATATAVVGDQVQFLGVDVALLGSNFTLATLDFTNSPTAVTMQSITAVSHAALPVLVVGMILLLALATLGLIVRKR